MTCRQAAHSGTDCTSGSSLASSMSRPRCRTAIASPSRSDRSPVWRSTYTSSSYGPHVAKTDDIRGYAAGGKGRSWCLTVTAPPDQDKLRRLLDVGTTLVSEL